MRELQTLTEVKTDASSFVKGLVSDLQNGIKAGQALENQLKKIADRLLDKALESLISGIFSAAAGGNDGFLSGILPHADGGEITGPGTATQTAFWRA
jgi:hypothetical protein